MVFFSRIILNSPDAVHTLAVSSDEKFFVSGSWDRTIKMWDLKKKMLIHTFEKAHKGISFLTRENNIRFYLDCSHFLRR